MTLHEALLTIALFLGTSILTALYIVARPAVRDARAVLRNRRRVS